MIYHPILIVPTKLTLLNTKGVASIATRHLGLPIAIMVRHPKVGIRLYPA
jgi:hypothetical protein